MFFLVFSPTISHRHIIARGHNTLTGVEEYLSKIWYLVVYGHNHRGNPRGWMDGWCATCATPARMSRIRCIEGRCVYRTVIDWRDGKYSRSTYELLSGFPSETHKARFLARQHTKLAFSPLAAKKSRNRNTHTHTTHKKVGEAFRRPPPS